MGFSYDHKIKTWPKNIWISFREACIMHAGIMCGMCHCCVKLAFSSVHSSVKVNVTVEIYPVANACIWNTSKCSFCTAFYCILPYIMWKECQWSPISCCRAVLSGRLHPSPCWQRHRPPKLPKQRGGAQVVRCHFVFVYAVSILDGEPCLWLTMNLISCCIHYSSR